MSEEDEPDEEDEDELEGGFVLEPTRGMHENIGILDFNKTYPSIFMQFNAGPETKLTREQAMAMDRKDYNETPAGSFFRKKPVAINVEVFEFLINTRKKLQEDAKRALSEYGPQSPEYNMLYQRQFRFKILTNSRFGIMGYRNDRFFDWEIFLVATKTGQYLLRIVIATIEGLGYEVVGGDTDSAMIRLKGKTLKEQIDEMERISKVVNDRIVEEVKKWCPDPPKIYIKVSVDKICRRFLSVEKKFYGMWIVYEDDTNLLEKGTDYVMWKGLPNARRDSSVLVENILDVLGNVVMRGDFSTDHKEKVRRWVKKIIKCIPLMPWSTICQPCSASQTLEELEKENKKRADDGKPLKSVSEAIRAFHYSSTVLGLNVDRKADMKLVVDREKIKGSWPNQTQGDHFVVALDEEDEDAVRDSFSPLISYYENMVLKKVKPLVEAVGIKLSDLEVERNCDANEV